MTYQVRSTTLEVKEDHGAASEVASIVKDAGALDLKRGMLKVTSDSVVFAPSVQESRLLDGISQLSTIFEAMLFFYDQYETSFDDAHRFPEYQNLSHESITGVSVINKGKANEVCIESSELPEDTYLRLRIDEGSSILPGASGSKGPAKRIGGEILEHAKRHGDAEEFNAGGLYSGPTRHLSAQPTDPDTTSTGETGRNWTKIGLYTFAVSILLFVSGLGIAIVFASPAAAAGVSTLSTALFSIGILLVIVGFIT